MLLLGAHQLLDCVAEDRPLLLWFEPVQHHFGFGDDRHTKTEILDQPILLNFVHKGVGLQPGDVW